MTIAVSFWLARELEQELGLEPAKPPGGAARAGAPRMTGRPSLGDVPMLARSSIGTFLADCYRVSDNGKAFQAALGECGFTPRGDRRSYLAVEVESGALYAIDKRLTGDSAAKIRERRRTSRRCPTSPPWGRTKIRPKCGRDGQDGNAKETRTRSNEQRQEDWRELYSRCRR